MYGPTAEWLRQLAVNPEIAGSRRDRETFFAPKNNLLWNKLVSFIGGGDNYYQLTSVSFSICILRHASLFRSYSGNLPAMF